MSRILVLIFSVFNPRWWLPFARGIKSLEGWCPPMMLIAITSIVGFCSELARGSFLALSFLYLWSACWFTVISISLFLVFLHSFRNVRRYGLSGFNRPRFWFEIARSSFVLGVMAVAVAFFIRSSEFVGDCQFCFLPFGLASTLGYLTAFATGRFETGRAKQCVDFFYPLGICLFAILVILLLFESKLDALLEFGPVFAAIVFLCFLHAMVLWRINRFDHGIRSTAVGDE